MSLSEVGVETIRRAQAVHPVVDVQIEYSHISRSPEQKLVCDETDMKNIANDTSAAGFEILQSKGATYYGIGAALVRVVRAILRNENGVRTVSSPVPKSLGLGEVTLLLPAVINREGMARVYRSRSIRRNGRPLKSPPRS